MWKKRKLFGALGAVAIALVALTVVLARTGGSSANADANTFESLLAAKMGISVDTLHMMESAGISAAAEHAASEGKISNDQASKLKALSISPLLEQAFSDLATATNSSEQSLFDGLAGGKTLAEIASANGVDAATLKSNLSGLASKYIDMGVTSGVISADQASQAKAAANDANLTKLINSSINDLKR